MIVDPIAGLKSDNDTELNRLHYTSQFDAIHKIKKDFAC